MAIETAGGDRSLGELLADLMRETTTLVRQEVTLAKNEMTEKATEAGKNVGSLLVGGAVAYAGALFILAAVALLLWHLGLSAWVAVLIVGLVAAGAGAALVSKGLKALKGQDFAPRQTVESIKEDGQWAKQQMK